MDKTPEQKDYTINENQYTEEDGLIQRNLTSFLIGAVFVIILPVLGLFIFLHSRNSSSNKQTTTVQSASTQQTATPTGAQGQTTPALAQSGTTYTNNQFNYSVKMPANWVWFLKLSMGNGYQIGFHPTNSSDTPIVINSQTNPQSVPLSALINAEFPNAATTTKTVANTQATVVTDTNRGIASYFLTHDGNVFEISGVTTSTVYAQALNQIVSTFTFTK